MKNLVFVITLFLSFNSNAQNVFEITDVFVRVYDLQGKKIGKGNIYSISETSLHLNKKGESLEFSVSEIGSIKAKRSAGNNILIHSAIGATVIAVLLAATADSEGYFASTAVEGAAVGALVGGISGAARGGINSYLNKPKSYEISGDKVKLEAFKKMILNDK